MNPFPRSVLGAAFHMPTITKPTRRTYVQAWQVVAITALWHRTDSKVRWAAWEMFKRCSEPNRDALLLIVISRRPFRLVEETLEEMES